MEIRKVSTLGAYNAKRYITHEAASLKKPLVVAFDGHEIPEEKIINAAAVFCKNLGRDVIWLKDSKKDEVIELKVTDDADKIKL